jgi:hypothetical protein
MNTTAPPTATTSGQTGWWIESISDGGCHYGTYDKGTVTALCGRAFLPLPHPVRDRVERQSSPADKAHGCSECKSARVG